MADLRIGGPPESRNGGPKSFVTSFDKDMMMMIKMTMVLKQRVS